MFLILISSKWGSNCYVGSLNAHWQPRGQLSPSAVWLQSSWTCSAANMNTHRRFTGTRSIETRAGEKHMNNAHVSVKRPLSVPSVFVHTVVGRWCFLCQDLRTRKNVSKDGHLCFLRWEVSRKRRSYFFSVSVQAICRYTWIVITLVFSRWERVAM